eukprot:TRINITY_DN5851_c0_g1_i2.p2 TRINITY_DN5851_c0_g1~~TRINITY_DN5851_c0_g1_i2.p2  ORF type:complete len:134 (+),score=22.98 TRINITY_DN5851_c0_g1_i2:558-959(+)
MKDNPRLKTNYYHHVNKLEEFEGFQQRQLRLRKGGKLDLHLDRNSSKLTVLIYLNSHWKGGILKLKILPPHLRSKENIDIIESSTDVKVVEPRANQMVIFWSDCVPHLVTPIMAPRLSYQVFLRDVKEVSKKE